MATEIINSTPTFSAEDLASARGASGVSGSERLEQKALGQDEFFKLLTTQLASQDPLSPMEDTAFIAQMANFSELEMTSQLTKSFQQFTSSQQFSASQGYIGKFVTLSDGLQGMVKAVDFQDNEARVFVETPDGDLARSVNMINKVEMAPPGS